MSDRPGPRGRFYILAAVAIALAIWATIGAPASDANSVAGLHRHMP